MMSWRRIGTSFQELGAVSLLLGFSILLLLKLDHTLIYSWWIIFLPLWLFHAVVARGRFSLPAPSVPHDRHWAPCHAVVATPLLIAFELLLCIYLESTYVSLELLCAIHPLDYDEGSRFDKLGFTIQTIRKTSPVSKAIIFFNFFTSFYIYRIPEDVSYVTGSAAVNLKVVFLPLLTFEATILVDNFRMCKALLPGDDESMSDDAVLESLPHLWVAFSMVFFLVSTVFTLLKLSGGFDTLGWWDLFINFCIAEFFAFLLCTKWSNPMIHGNSNSQEASSSSSTITYLGGRSGQVVSSENYSDEGCCLLPDIGGHIMKIPIIAFQLLLCMRLEGTPPSAKSMPLSVVFSPLLLLQGVGVLFAASRFTEKIVLLLRSGGSSGRYFTISSTAYELFGFFHRGSRFLGWWSIDDVSREEQARLYSSDSSGYNTFCNYTPEIVKKMPKKELAEEVWRLQAVLGEQSEITKFSQQEYERLQSEKVLCRVCFEGEISVVLLPCRHRILCSTCSARCKRCPICRVPIEERLPVYDV